MGVFKNGVGRPSNETIKKRNIFKGICVLLVLIIIGMMVYILNDKGIINISSKEDKKTVDKKTDSGATEESEELDINSKEVTDLFKKYNLYTWFLDILVDKEEKFSYFYQKDLLSKDVSDSIKFIYSIGNLYLKESIGENGEKYKDLTVKNGEILDFNVINEKSVELFGNKINVSKLDNDINVIGYCFKYDSDSNKVYVNGGCGVGDSSSIDMETKIINAHKNNNKLIIENKLMFTYSVPENNVSILKKYDTYANIEKYKIVEISNQENVTDIKIDDYLDKLDTYRWIFKENTDGSYTFESVEKVK